MADFGRIPKTGVGWGRVPAFVFKDSSLKPGPKALYGCFCSHANERGHFWRSLDRLAEEFGMSRKQIKRWLHDLERAGLVTQIGWQGEVPLLMVIRDPAGCSWAQARNLDNVIQRRRKSVPHGKEGARRRWHAQETPVSKETDTHVPEKRTPMSPEHNPKNKTSLTGEAARQVGTPGAGATPNKRLYGLKHLNPNPKNEIIQDALNRFAGQFSWECADRMGVPALAARLAADNPGMFTQGEALAVLAPELRR